VRTKNQLGLLNLLHLPILPPPVSAKHRCSHDSCGSAWGRDRWLWMKILWENESFKRRMKNAIKVENAMMLHSSPFTCRVHLMEDRWTPPDCLQWSVANRRHCCHPPCSNQLSIVADCLVWACWSFIKLHTPQLVRLLFALSNESSSCERCKWCATGTGRRYTVFSLMAQVAA